MPGPLDDRLSRRERQIMDVLYAAGQASAGEVHAKLPDAPSYTTVRTLLRILEEKGHLSHQQVGVKYVYAPLRPRGHAGRSAFDRVLQIFFDGSLAKAVAAHLGEDASDLPPEELQHLADIVRKARKKGR